jgi:hypothetical protein
MHADGGAQIGRFGAVADLGAMAGLPGPRRSVLGDHLGKLLPCLNGVRVFIAEHLFPVLSLRCGADLLLRGTGLV